MMIIVLIVIIVGIFLVHKKTAFFAYHFHKGEVRIIRDVQYVDDGTQAHRLDLYLPKDKTDYPLIYFVYGGNWNSGDKNYYQWITGLYGNIGVTLARQGIGVAVANYRLHPQTNVDGMLEDITQGVNFVIAQAPTYGWQKDIYLMGHSAGGHLVSLLAAQKKVNAAGVIALSPVLDISAMHSQSKQDYRETVIYPLFGKTVQEQEKYSPHMFWDAMPENTCVLVGEKDYGHIRNRGVELTGATVLPGYSHSAIVTRIGSGNDLVTPEIMKCIKT